jgi:hypothetical protein
MRRLGKISAAWLPAQIPFGAISGFRCGSRGRAGYYRDYTALFLDGAEKLRVEEPNARFLATHRPDLPLRFGRSSRLQWAETPFSTPAAFEAHVRQAEPASFEEPALLADRLVLIPRSRNGAMLRPLLVQAENGKALTLLELLWHAQQHQRPLKQDPTGGIGFYRSGIEKKGVPSYFIGGFMDPAGALKWHAEALPGE